MQLDLLKQRARKILTSGNIVSRNKLDGELRVIPGLRFTCNGSITSLLLGADARIVNGSKYPQVGIWRLKTNSFNFKYYDREEKKRIKLDAGTFSPDGVLQYNLKKPLPFQSGDVLGVWQPPEVDSAVRLFYDNDASAPVIQSVDFLGNIGIVYVNLAPDVASHHILILPFTGILVFMVNAIETIIFLLQILLAVLAMLFSLLKN